jgi:splicing factor 3A subunit 3
LLIDYLFGFIERSLPFCDIEEHKKSISQNFVQKYREVTESWGPNYFEYCDKSFDSGQLLDNHLRQKSHSRNVEKATAVGGVERLTEERRARKRMFEELMFTVNYLISSLDSKFAATIQNCRRRQSISAAVLQAEQNLDAPIVFEESDQEDDEHFYNPKGLPLGWDGKPIPYWLYKLHGLSVEYKCEICGNRSYWGALAFERHFFDNRHINGLKALGIPPTRHFVYVTGVNEAINLFDKIKKSLAKEVWQPGDEEIETEDGHVMSVKTYQDLVRQGLIKPKK